MKRASCVRGCDEGWLLGPAPRHAALPIVTAGCVPASGALPGRACGPRLHRNKVTLIAGSGVIVIELKTKVHPKVRNHGEGPY